MKENQLFPVDILFIQGLQIGGHIFVHSFNHVLQSVLPPIDGGEAYIVLPNDGRVQWHEVEQNDDVVVKTALWIKHQPTRVSDWGVPMRIIYQ